MRKESIRTFIENCVQAAPDAIRSITKPILAGEI
jgi:hypothetical protein